MDFKTILYEKKEPLGRIVLNRPEVRNAFDDLMISELHQVLDEVEKEGRVRVVIITGAGDSFCAGADLNWMRRVKDWSYEKNYEDALKVAELMEKIYTFPKPIITRVNGATIGGGTGIVASSDIAVASENAFFGLAEVKIGLVPSVISPYLVKRCGERVCREIFLTGERISAKKALEHGLVNYVVHPSEMDKKVEEIVEMLLTSGPNALRICKELIKKVSETPLREVKYYTADIIAKIRISEEGQEGIASFLEKRKPKWANKT
ncbi:MAG: enoyl-CoA hydratase-related protein [Candidatus Aminicenantia bacterium]